MPPAPDSPWMRRTAMQRSSSTTLWRQFELFFPMHVRRIDKNFPFRNKIRGNLRLCDATACTPIFNMVRCTHQPAYGKSIHRVYTPDNRHYVKKTFLPKTLKCLKFGHRKSVFARLRPDKACKPRSWLLKVGFNRVVRIGKIVVGGGCRRLVICREYINWRGICKGTRFSFYVQKFQVAFRLRCWVTIIWLSDLI